MSKKTKVTKHKHQRAVAKQIQIFHDDEHCFGLKNPENPEDCDCQVYINLALGMPASQVIEIIDETRMEQATKDALQRVPKREIVPLPTELSHST